jgi:hypothetical protein
VKAVAGPVELAWPPAAVTTMFPGTAFPRAGTVNVAGTCTVMPDGDHDEPVTVRLVLPVALTNATLPCAVPNPVPVIIKPTSAGP